MAETEIARITIGKSAFILFRAVTYRDLQEVAAEMLPKTAKAHATGDASEFDHELDRRHTSGAAAGLHLLLLRIGERCFQGCSPGFLTDAAVRAIFECDERGRALLSSQQFAGRADVLRELLRHQAIAMMVARAVHFPAIDDLAAAFAGGETETVPDLKPNVTRH